MKTTPHR